MDSILTYKPQIEILAALGGFFSALIALYTLIEIKRQRRATYKPELFLDSFCFYILDNPLLSENHLPKFKSSTYNDKRRIKSEKDSIYVDYKLENLGFGVAKSVRCEWEFDYLKALKEIENVIPKDFKITKSFGYYFFNNQTIQISFHPDDLYVRDFDFIAPSSIAENYKTHSVPRIIVESYLYFLLFKYKLTSESGKSFYHEDFKTMPKAKLKLTYKDLANKTYKKTLNISFQCACTIVSEDDTIVTTKEFGIFYVNVDE